MGMAARTVNDCDMSVVCEPGELGVVEQVAVDDKRPGKQGQWPKIIQRAAAGGDGIVLPGIEFFEKEPQWSTSIRQQQQFFRRFGKVNCQRGIVGVGESDEVAEEIRVNRIGGVGADSTEAVVGTLFGEEVPGERQAGRT